MICTRNQTTATQHRRGAIIDDKPVHDDVIKCIHFRVTVPLWGDSPVNRLFRRRSKKTSKSLAFVRGIHRWISRIKGQCFHLMMSSCSWSLSHLALCLDTNKFVASSLMGGVAHHLFDEIINYFDILASPDRYKSPLVVANLVRDKILTKFINGRCNSLNELSMCQLIILTYLFRQ